MMHYTVLMLSKAVHIRHQAVIKRVKPNTHHDSDPDRIDLEM